VSPKPVDLFRTLTNGVYVIGVAHDGKANAFTAAWVSQVSFDPLLVAVSINPEHASYPLMRESRAFVINVLRRDQLELARHFGCQSGRTTDKLAGFRFRAGRLGAPILLDAVACLECRVVDRMTAGDHELVVGKVIGGELLTPDALPLGYRETGNLDESETLYPTSFPPDATSGGPSRE
jgi:flavin reductase (DIM6/NTAB) family NADH-FMN oxidoreductase RutF